ncbi:MAG: ATP-dependent Clp protease adaptor ClpS [Acidobacteriota bacterium]
METDPAGDEELATEQRQRTKKPRRYQVLLHNDDFTTQEFVVDVLLRHFGKSPAEAVRVMLEVHHRGLGVAGVYSRDVAETKVVEVTAEARAAQMPLLVTAEPE